VSRVAGTANREQLDEHDWEIITRLGYAMARAQLFEFAMVKMREAQQHDLNLPLEERWVEIAKWLKESAGTTSGRLEVPKPIRKDLIALVESRNAVAHHAYRSYVAARGNRGDRAVEEWAAWFEAQVEKLGPAYNAVMSIALALRDETLDDEGLLRVWRESIPEPVEPVSFPSPAAD
jgi:hypothetical protein